MRLVFLVLLLTLMVSSAQQHTLHPQQVITDQSVAIYLVDHGWHIGIIIPAHKIRADLPLLNRRFSAAEFIEFGWGDKRFYQSKEIKIGLALRALFLPTNTVVHAVEVPRNPYHYFPNADITTLYIEPHQFGDLIKFINHSFARDSNGYIRPDTQGIYGNSQFYVGQGIYHFMQTCNKWTAQALNAAGLKINPMFRLTADSITYAPAIEAARNAFLSPSG